MQSDMAGRENTRGMGEVSHHYNTKERRLGRMQQNYRTIALLSHVGKVLMMVLLERLKAQMEPHLSEEQAGFRKDRSTIHQILILIRLNYS